MCCKKLRVFLPIQKKYVLCGILCVFLLDFFGFFENLLEEDFNSNFHYPYNGDVSEFVMQLEKNQKPRIRPINVYNFSYLHTNANKCKENKDNELRLVYMVKSSIENFEKRRIIRRTWGFEKRFSDVRIHTLFVLGNTENTNVRTLIDDENQKYNDIIQLDFIDNYYNNTFKTMGAFKWIIEFCPNSKYYFFSDDDIYISTKNVLRFLHNPTKYPDYIKLPPQFLGSDVNFKTKNKTDLLKSFRNHLKNIYRYELPKNVTLYAGFVFLSSPLRHKSSKWYVSLWEYPYNMWPPYISAGAYILSKNALSKLYYTSFYTKYFKFDDIYLGLVALKAGIKLFHCDEFYFYKKKYNRDNYKYVIASHGFDNPSELERVWNQQKEDGNA